MESNHQLLAELQVKLQSEPTFFYDHILGCAHWSKQDQITESVFRNQRTTVPSCHGAGKSYTAARVALAFLYAHPNSIVATTAPTFRQVENVIWRELRGAVATAKVQLGGDLFKTRLEIDPNWYALGLSSEKPDRLQGFHAKSGHMLVIVDEAAGVKAEILMAIEGLLTSKDVHLLYIGNPTVGSGPFYQSAKSSYFQKIRISALDTPNFKINKIRTVGDLLKIPSLEAAEALPLAYPQLVTPAWAWLRLHEWGAESPMFKARVLAEFPEEGDDTLIGLSLVDLALEKDFTEEEMKLWPRRNVLAIDVARYGADSTSLVGMNNFKMIGFRKHTGKDLMQTVGIAITMFEELGFDRNMDTIAVDDTGLGGGVTDRLNELGYNVMPINFGGASSDPETYVNLKAEIYWYLRSVFKDELISIKDAGKIASQIPTIRYSYTSSAKLQIVSKETMKKQGLGSPDDADALAIACWAVRAASSEFPGPETGSGNTIVGNIYRKIF